MVFALHDGVVAGSYEMIGKQERSLSLIAEFVNGYADGWHFAVGECFRDELDIKWTLRRVDKKDVWCWTQGPYYCFAEGHTLFDSAEAYVEWSEAVKRFGVMCKVIRGTPNTLKGKRLIPGYVTFYLKKPDSISGGLDHVGQHTTTQDEFVAFLKTGRLPEKA